MKKIFLIILCLYVLVGCKKKNADLNFDEVTKETTQLVETEQGESTQEETTKPTDETEKKNEIAKPESGNSANIKYLIDEHLVFNPPSGKITVKQALALIENSVKPQNNFELTAASNSFYLVYTGSTTIDNKTCYEIEFCEGNDNNYIPLVRFAVSLDKDIYRKEVYENIYNKI